MFELLSDLILVYFLFFLISIVPLYTSGFVFKPSFIYCVHIFLMWQIQWSLTNQNLKHW